MCYQKDYLYTFLDKRVKLTTTDGKVYTGIVDNYESESDSGSDEEELFLTTDDGKFPFIGRSRIADIELA